MRQTWIVRVCITLFFCSIGVSSQPAPSFYHKTDEILEFFRTTALKLPQRVR